MSKQQYPTYFTCNVWGVSVRDLVVMCMYVHRRGFSKVWVEGVQRLCSWVWGMGAPRFLCVVMPVSCCGGRSLFVGGWSGRSSSLVGFRGLSPLIWAWMEGWAGGDQNADSFCHIPCRSPSAQVSPCGHLSTVGVVPRGHSWALVNHGGGSSWPVGHCRCSSMVVLGTHGHSWAVVTIPRSWWWILIANCWWSWWALVVFHGGCQKRVW